MSADRPLPLAGRRVLVTRPAARSRAFLARLRALGARPVACPAIACVPTGDRHALEQTLGAFGARDWIVFTSVSAVAPVLESPAARRWVSASDAPRMAAVGAATAAAMARRAFRAAIVGSQGARHLVPLLGVLAGVRVLLPRSDIARADLPAALRAAGAFVEEVVVYRTIAAPDLRSIAGRLRAEPPDVLTFSSPSAVRHFLSALADVGSADLMRGARRPRIVCTGPTTARAAERFGLRVDAIARASGDDELTAAVVAACASLS